MEGDRGLGSTLIGGAGGAFLGNKLGGGALGTIGGLVAGAIGANVLSDKYAIFFFLPTDEVRHSANPLS